MSNAVSTEIMGEMEMSGRPLFELHGPDGHTWRLFEDGRAEGFPNGTIVLNGAAPLFARLRSWIVHLEGASIASKKDETPVS